ncbi:hypothetical protein D3C71_1021840 [compost metagenome]
MGSQRRRWRSKVCAQPRRCVQPRRFQGFHAVLALPAALPMEHRGRSPPRHLPQLRFTLSQRVAICSLCLDQPMRQQVAKIVVIFPGGPWLPSLRVETSQQQHL